MFGRFGGRLDPVVHPTGPGAIELEFIVWPDPDRRCDEANEVMLTVEALHGMIYSGPESWTVKSTKEAPYSTTISVTIPPDATTGLVIRAKAKEGLCSGVFAAYFAVKEDTVEFHRGSPWSSTPKPRPRPEDGWTEEKLATYIEIEVDLTEQMYLDIARKAIGDLLDGKGLGKHRLRITRRVFRDRILTHAIAFRVLSPQGSESQSPTPQHDSSSESSTDSSDLQGTVRR